MCAMGTITAQDLESVTLDGPAKQLFEQIQAYRREAHLSARVPGLLYHYTTSRGLLGIVEGDTLWATHIGYLNDASELLYACGIVREALEKRRDRETSALARDFCDNAMTSFNLAESLGIYVACFCEDGDLLSQWRGYADAGEGYSIGMRAQELTELGGYGFKFFFGKVEYRRPKQEEIVGAILDKTIGGLTTLAKTKKDAATAVTKCCKVFQQSIWFALVVFKDATFEMECEWRAIRLLTPGEEATAVKLRALRGQLVPYIELDFLGSPWRKGGKLPLACVYHGPTLNPELTKKSLKMLLSKSGHATADALGSRIPLRVVGR
jgi:Protein of unknown function (DUF2971)